MNKSTFGVSIILNVALAITVVALLVRKPAALEPETAPQKTVTTGASKIEDRKSRPVILITTNSSQKFDWRTVESADYKQYIANLRAIGVPEDTIRDIIVADINKMFESRRKELSVASTNKFQYWKAGNPFAEMFNEEKMEQSKQLAAEKKALLKELLGVDVPDKNEMFGGINPMEAYSTMLDFLPAEKHSAIMELEQKFGAKMMKSMKDARDNPKLMKQVMDEKDAEMAQLLGPKDKEEYDLRMSQTAMMMRMQMTDFQPTEQEFRDIFKLQKKFQDEFNPMMMGNTTPDVREKRTQAQKEMDDQIKANLGEPRFREYKYDQQWSQSSLRRVSQEFNVPKDQALKVFDINAEATDMAQKIRSNPSLSQEQRQAQLDAVRAETEKAVGGAIGADAAKAYIDRGTSIRDLNKLTLGRQAESPPPPVKAQ